MSDALLERTRAARDRFFESRRELLESLAARGQRPEAMFIGCSDSRVVPELLMGAGPGELFVVRLVANIVPPYGTAHTAVGSAAEYAVRHLKAKHIIVCGHTDCGGLKALDAAVDQAREPSIAGWIQYARAARSEADAKGLKGEARMRAVAEANVRLQLKNLQTFVAVQEAVSSGDLELHGWLYDLERLELREVPAEG